MDPTFVSLVFTRAPAVHFIKHLIHARHCPTPAEDAVNYKVPHPGPDGVCTGTTFKVNTNSSLILDTQIAPSGSQAPKRHNSPLSPVGAQRAFVKCLHALQGTEPHSSVTCSHR